LGKRPIWIKCVVLVCYVVGVGGCGCVRDEVDMRYGAIIITLGCAGGAVKNFWKKKVKLP